MARAIGVKRCDLDAYMRGDWSPEEQDAINLFLAGMLVEFTDLDLPTRGLLRRDIRQLAAQFAAPRHRPVIPLDPGADTGQEFIQRSDSYELDMPPGALAAIEELLADD
jgi:hypothetical protein